MALILDMDGVIVDSTEVHTRAWSAYLATHGIDLPEIEKRMLGKHNDEIVRDFFRGTELNKQAIFDHGARKEQIYRDMMGGVVTEKLIPGVSGFIARHRDLPLGLATNAEPANVDFVLHAAGIREYFRAIVNGQVVERPKPFPDIYLRVAQLLGNIPESCVVFEDSQTGVDAARAAGMRVVGVATTLHEFQDVDLVVKDFLDPGLERWLDSVTRRA